MIQMSIDGVPEPMRAAPERDEQVVRFGMQIRRARQQRSMSITGLAREAGITPGYLSRIERGHASPSLRVAHRLSGVLGGSVTIALN